MRRLTILFPVALALGCSPSSSPLRTAAIEDGGANANAIPITIRQTSSTGTMRFSVPIRIGDGPPIDAFLDTGSSGLRILAGAVPAAALARTTDTTVTYSYHSGLAIDGVVALATVRLDAWTTPAPIPIMLVQKVGCTAARPTCDAAGKTVDDYRFFGGFQAILGVGLRSRPADQGVGSPLAQLAGHPPFIVRSPSYGGTSGTLELAPTADELAAFTRYDLPALTGGAPLTDGTPAWEDRFGLPACLQDQTAAVDYCVPAELDSGNPPTYVDWPAQTSTTYLSPGTAVQVTVGPPDAPLGRYQFVVAAERPGIDLVEIEPTPGAGFMNLGTALFFRYDVLFDPQRGTVGLAPR